MSLRIFAWGRWGARVLEKMSLPGNDEKYLAALINEDLCGAGHFTDPLLAESFCAGLAPVNINKIDKDSQFVFQASRGFPLGAGNHDPFRLHLVHAGEHFGSGAASAFLRLKADDGIDMGVVFLPPGGCNEATTGRFLAEIYGIVNFFDICVLMDGEAAAFAPMDAGDVDNYAAALAEILLAGERSGCLAQLLLRSPSRVFSFCAAHIQEVASSSSLGVLWRASSVALDAVPPGELPGRGFLAFSVSAKRENHLAQIYKKNIPAPIFIHLPFYPRHEWRTARQPGREGKKGELPRFTGVFCSGHLPPRGLKLLRAWRGKYWDSPKPAQNEESADFEARRWMRSRHMEKLWRPLSLDILRKTRDLMKDGWNN